MNRDTAYLTALMVVAISILLTGLSSIDFESPSLPSILMIVGGLGLLGASAYYLYASASAAPENDGLYWIVILGAMLTLLGVVLQLLGV